MNREEFFFPTKYPAAYHRVNVMERFPQPHHSISIIHFATIILINLYLPHHFLIYFLYIASSCFYPRNYRTSVIAFDLTQLYSSHHSFVTYITHSTVKLSKILIKAFLFFVITIVSFFSRLLISVF